MRKNLFEVSAAGKWRQPTMMLVPPLTVSQHHIYRLEGIVTKGHRSWLQNTKSMNYGTFELLKPTANATECTFCIFTRVLRMNKLPFQSNCILPDEDSIGFVGAPKIRTAIQII